MNNAHRITNLTPINYLFILKEIKRSPCTAGEIKMVRSGSPPTVDCSIEDEADEVGEVLRVEGVARRLAHVPSDGERNLMNLRGAAVTAGKTPQKS